MLTKTTSLFFASASSLNRLYRSLSFVPLLISVFCHNVNICYGLFAYLPSSIFLLIRFIPSHIQRHPVYLIYNHTGTFLRLPGCEHLPTQYSWVSYLIRHLPNGCDPFLSAVTGVEPVNTRIKTSCLTSWRYRYINGVWCGRYPECAPSFIFVQFRLGGYVVFPLPCHRHILFRDQPSSALSFSVRCPALAHIIRVWPGLCNR